MSGARLTGLLLVATLASAPATAMTRRYAIVVGVNDGGPGRELLRYATTDAQNLAQILVELGGVIESDLVLLLDADRAQLLASVEQLRQRLAQIRGSDERRELIFYYSGHADSEGLLLGNERLAFRDLRQALVDAPADVRLVVVDACASGELTRHKGGRHRPAFLADSSSAVTGLAIVTSSSADEASQESDRIGASFFTHYLSTALRGAADDNNDDVVTLAEAYQYTYAATLARTQATQVGPQHPSYDMQLTGAGDLVLTDLRSVAASIVLTPVLTGVVFVRDSQGRLIAELRKLPGRTTELGLAPGSYTVALEHDSGLWIAELELKTDQHRVLELSDFKQLELEPGRARGNAPSLAQVLELDTVYERAFFELAVLPWLTTNGDLAPRSLNHVSLSLLGNRSARLYGLGLSFGINHALDDVIGAQIAIGFNRVDHELIGAQIAIGGNHALSSSAALQLAAGVNITDQQHRGAQVGPCNLAWGRVLGAQVGVLNFADEVTGGQVGLVNIGRHVTGGQLGVLNLAEEIEGAPIGLLSLAGNGEWHVETWVDDVHLVNVGFSLGGPMVHTLYYAALQPAYDTLRWTLGAGFGTHVELTAAWFADVDLSLGYMWYGDWAMSSVELLSRARFAAGYQLSPQLAAIAGIGLNLAVAKRNPMAQLSPVPSWQMRKADPLVALWPGVFFGLKL